MRILLLFFILLVFFTFYRNWFGSISMVVDFNRDFIRKLTVILCKRQKNERRNIEGRKADGGEPLFKVISLSLSLSFK